MSRYTIEFSDFAPTVVEVREAETPEFDAMAIPADAMQFSFVENEDRRFVAPFYYVTEEHDFGGLHELQAKYPAAAVHGPEGSEGAERFAYVRWSHPAGSGFGGEILVPMLDWVAVVDRATGRVLSS